LIGEEGKRLRNKMQQMMHIDATHVILCVFQGRGSNIQEHGSDIRRPASRIQYRVSSITPIVSPA